MWEEGKGESIDFQDEWTVRGNKNWLNGRSQSVVISGRGSSWAPVTSGVPQGSYCPWCCLTCSSVDKHWMKSRCLLSSFDNTKLGRVADTPEGWAALQRHLNRLERWVESCPKFNKGKCRSCIWGGITPSTSTGWGWPAELDLYQDDWKVDWRARGSWTSVWLEGSWPDRGTWSHQRHTLCPELAEMLHVCFYSLTQEKKRLVIEKNMPYAVAYGWNICMCTQGSDICDELLLQM